jgi:hypothetical protein
MNGQRYIVKQAEKTGSVLLWIVWDEFEGEMAWGPTGDRKRAEMEAAWRNRGEMAA